jgi:hypothetical protein
VRFPRETGPKVLGRDFIREARQHAEQAQRL